MQVEIIKATIKQKPVQANLLAYNAHDFTHENSLGSAQK